MFFADSMTIYSTTFLYSQISIRSTGATFGDARPGINAVTGMTFMTAACGIDVPAYAGHVPPDALTGECKHSIGEYAFIEARDAD
jgi:hypothetical protein